MLEKKIDLKFKEESIAKNPKNDPQAEVIPFAQFYQPEQSKEYASADALRFIIEQLRGRKIYA